MTTGLPTTHDDLDPALALRVAHDDMLLGMIVNRGLLPQVVMRGGGLDGMNDVAIDLWMGASPVYTHRMRRLMGIEGDGVEAIMKALQLDVGFVHQYMDVVYELHDDRSGAFWLNHCGALLDAEPHGEPNVFGMCHTIEDPTFDATALATNPRARIRPIHRPPRSPADRHPHCHWTIRIDPENEPVGPARLTEQVSGLPLAGVPNAVTAGSGGGDAMTDYRGPLRPGFRLADLAPGTLAAVAREFRVQTHLLVAAGELAVRERFGDDAGRDMVTSAWVGSSWIASERLAATFGAEGGAAAAARVLALTPALPPGFARAVRVDGDAVHVTLVPEVAGLLDPDHPGCPGLLAAGAEPAVAAMVHAVEPQAAVAVRAGSDRVEIDVTVDRAREPAPEPPEIPLMRIGRVAGWSFDLPAAGAGGQA